MSKKKRFLIILIAVTVAGVSVLKIYDAAVGEAEFLYAVSHYPVVSVSVDADVAAPAPAPLEAGFGNSMRRFCAGQTVNCTVGLTVIGPLSAFN